MVNLLGNIESAGRSRGRTNLSDVGQERVLQLAGFKPFVTAPSSVSTLTEAKNLTTYQLPPAVGTLGDHQPSSKGVHDPPTLDCPFQQLSVFASNYATGEALHGLPLYVVANFAPEEPGAGTAENGSSDPLTGNTGRSTEGGIRLRALTDTPQKKVLPGFAQALGRLTTDHAGYASFNLEVLNSVVPISAVSQNGTAQDSIATWKIKQLWVLPFTDPLLAADALKSGEVGATYISLRLHLDEDVLQSRALRPLGTSMQKPSMLDYQLSPGSFTLPSKTLTGEGGCETLLPGTLATHQFQFYEVAQLSDVPQHAVKPPATGVPPVAGVPPAAGIPIALGVHMDYRAELFAIGHVLGQLEYSLPLAPGEIVNIAVVDWAAENLTNRTESTGYTESLDHAQNRNRTLTEGVESVLNEWQRGGSFMAGAAGTFGGGGWGASAAMGGAYTTSSGTRELAASTVQQIADAYHQAASAMRDLRSSVVVSSKQSEESKVQTRTVTNYNHSHTLTILYYEVLRQYRLVTSLVQQTYALFVDFSSRILDFTLVENLSQAQILRDLLPAELQKGFDGLSAIAAAERRYGRTGLDVARPKAYITFKDQGAQIWEGDKILSSFSLGLEPEINSFYPEDDNNTYNFGLHAHFYYTDGAEEEVDMILVMEQGTFARARPYYFKPAKPRPWKDLRAVQLSFSTGNAQDAPDNPTGFVWLIAHPQDGSDDITLYDTSNPTDRRLSWRIRPLTRSPEIHVRRPSPPFFEQSLPPEVVTSFINLADHLSGQSLYYNRLLWRRESLEDRADWLDGAGLGRYVQNRLLDMHGSWAALPTSPGCTLQQLYTLLGSPKELLDTVTHTAPATRPSVMEQLVSLPARGVFAEGQLGHCNSSEVIDDSRFWDWQKSPIPHQAAKIADINANTKKGDPQNPAPSNFPTPIIISANPGELPDPTALGAALKVLGTPEIFRDQSAAKEVSALLQKLSDNATTAFSAGTKNQDRSRLMNDIRSSPELSSDQKTELIKQVLSGDAGGNQKGGGGGGQQQGSGGGGTAVGSGGTAGVGVGSGGSTGDTGRVSGGTGGGGTSSNGGRVPDTSGTPTPRPNDSGPTAKPDDGMPSSGGGRGEGPQIPGPGAQPSPPTPQPSPKPTPTPRTKLASTGDASRLVSVHIIDPTVQAILGGFATIIVEDGSKEHTAFMGPPFILGPVSKENVPLNNGFVDIITPPWDGFYITVRATLEIDHLDVAGANGGAIPRTQGEGDPNMPSYNDLFINPRLRKATMMQFSGSASFPAQGTAKVELEASVTYLSRPVSVRKNNEKGTGEIKGGSSMKIPIDKIGELNVELGASSGHENDKEVTEPANLLLIQEGLVIKEKGKP